MTLFSHLDRLPFVAHRFDRFLNLTSCDPEDACTTLGIRLTGHVSGTDIDIASIQSHLRYLRVALSWTCVFFLLCPYLLRHFFKAKRSLTPPPTAPCFFPFFSTIPKTVPALHLKHHSQLNRQTDTRTDGDERGDIPSFQGPKLQDVPPKKVRTISPNEIIGVSAPLSVAA